ncbi:MAG TPA: GNAT family N-acetyltransferase, partial [Candidatus Eisenbacteria bacterium]|nr:GNAT family N-acetyltransferase [Candidatus Eisenbacteria bacterium]
MTTREAFAGLRDDWNGLLAASGRETPFLTHEWFHCCVEAFRGPDLHVLVVRDGTRAIGIAPLWRDRDRWRGLEVRRIGFITCPDTPMVEILAAADRREEVVGAVLSDLRATRDVGWDLATLSQWPADAPTAAAALALLASRKTPHFVARASLVPRLRVSGDWETYWQSRPPLFRKSRRGIVNRMGRAGVATVRLVREDPSGDAFQAVLAISRRSWKEARGLAVSSRSETTEFFRRLTEAAGRKGWLFLWILELDGVPVAMEYDLQHDRTVYALRADIDESFKERSPGAYLEYH